MKRVIIKIIILPVLVLCLVLGGCTVSYADADKYKTGNAEFESSAVRSIAINWEAGDVEIAYHDSDTVTVVEKTARPLSESDMMHYYLDGDTLRIQYKESGAYITTLRETVTNAIDNNHKKLIVTIPKDKHFESVSVDVSSATVNAPEINADKIVVDSSSGEIKLGASDASEVSFDASSGSIYFTGRGKFGTVRFDTSSGSVNAVIDGEVGEIKSDTSSGEVSITASAADKFISNSSSGDLNAMFDVAPKELSVDTSSGKVNVTLPEDADFTAHVDMASGAFRCQLPSVMESENVYVCGSGKADYTFDAASGDITILKK